MDIDTDNAHPKEVLPLLKWPGGKRWLASFLAQIIHPVLHNTYYEPFLGAGAVFLYLQPKCSVLSDINQELIECFKAVRDQPESVVKSIWRYTNSRECYYKTRHMNPRTPISAAARFIYLNRTCWGGIYRLNKKGRFNVPYGNSGRIICRKDSLLAVGNSLKRAGLFCGDFEKAMAPAGKGDVIYADPPYTTVGANNGFIRYNENLFSWEDQERLAKACKKAAKRGAFVIVSGIWNMDILTLYKGWWAMKIKRHTCVARKTESRRVVSEVLLFSRFRPGHELKRI
jgi:DNA adenine methylase